VYSSSGDRQLETGMRLSSSNVTKRGTREGIRLPHAGHSWRVLAPMLSEEVGARKHLCRWSMCRGGLAVVQNFSSTLLVVVVVGIFGWSFNCALKDSPTDVNFGVRIDAPPYENPGTRSLRATMAISSKC